MRTPKTHTLETPWGNLQGTAVEILKGYNKIMKDNGCGYATVTLSAIRRLLRNKKANGNMFLWPKTT